MKNVFRGTFLAIALASLVACGDDHGGGGVELDASSETAMTRTMMLMAKEMTGEQREALQINLALIRQSIASSVDTDGMGVMEGYKAKQEAVMKTLDGMTASDIADEADSLK